MFKRSKSRNESILLPLRLSKNNWSALRWLYSREVTFKTSMTAGLHMTFWGWSTLGEKPARSRNWIQWLDYGGVGSGGRISHAHPHDIWKSFLWHRCFFWRIRNCFWRVMSKKIQTLKSSLPTNMTKSCHWNRFWTRSTDSLSVRQNDPRKQYEIRAYCNLNSTWNWPWIKKSVKDEPRAFLRVGLNTTGTRYDG